MPSVFVSAPDLPVVLEIRDQEPAEVADLIEDWCQRGEVTTLKHLPERIVVNWARLATVTVSPQRDPGWRPEQIVSYAIQIVSSP